jgi:SAM-dependent methyltransferase
VAIWRNAPPAHVGHLMTSTIPDLANRQLETMSESAPSGNIRRGSLVMLVFSTALFVSALLLFSLQPMFTKMVLPLLGGSPSVWSVAMVFFQAFLLLGYIYAHVLTRALDPRHAVIVHLLLLIVTFVTLPITVTTGFGKPPSDDAAFWLIGLFTVSIGLPFFAVAANAPMLQAWFARTGHSQAQDPYFLYGASNFGSFSALLAYPLLIEPFLTLRDQTRLWSAGFGVLTLLIAASGLLLALRWNRTREATASTRPAPVTTWPDRFKWMALAFVPSALLIAVTSRISTDIASAPFLWVVPLALFLLTFILTFRTGGDRVHHWLVRLQPYFVAPLVVGLMSGERAYWFVAIFLNLGVFMISTMICNRELYLRRPDARQLTEFYMWVSLGGVLGGIATGLIAPLVFPDVWEYPILIVLALLCRPGAFAPGRKVWIIESAIFATIVVLAVLPGIALGWKIPSDNELIWRVALVGIAALLMIHAKHPARLVGLTVLILSITTVYRPGLVQTQTVRSFFGVHKVVESYDGRFRTLYHGTTIHGAQRLRDEAGRPVTRLPEPLMYYFFGSPMGEAIAATRSTKHALNRVAVVGLGTGALACHAKPNEHWTYFEIDPVVVRLAQDKSKFRFLSDCAPQTQIILGDARLTLDEAPTQFDGIVLDAFSSDVVPVHLLTREALGIYLKRLADGGLLVFHLSNRYLELASVVAAVAATHGLITYVKLDRTVTPASNAVTMHENSLVAAVARREEDLASLTSQRSGWKRYEAEASVQPWTDDYSNILSALWRHHFAANPKIRF